jgi:hypothetical protein
VRTLASVPGGGGEFELTCVPGSAADGETLVCQTPRGTLVDVVVPRGLGAGAALRVNYVPLETTPLAAADAPGPASPSASPATVPELQPPPKGRRRDRLAARLAVDVEAVEAAEQGDVPASGAELGALGGEIGDDRLTVLAGPCAAKDAAPGAVASVTARYDSKGKLLSKAQATDRESRRASRDSYEELPDVPDNLFTSMDLTASADLAEKEDVTVEGANSSRRRR